MNGTCVSGGASGSIRVVQQGTLSKPVLFRLGHDRARRLSVSLLRSGTHRRRKVEVGCSVVIQGQVTVKLYAPRLDALKDASWM